MTSRSVEVVRKGNDLLRGTFLGIFGRVVLTTGVRNSLHREEMISSVREFNDFNSGNDPYGEHDFGHIKLDKFECMFKIDYYSSDYIHGADPYSESFKRVLTIMLPCER